MSLSRIKGLFPLALLLMLVLAACGGTTSSPAKPSPTPPTPTFPPDQGAKLLGQAGKAFDSANTLHAILKISINGSGFNGIVTTEVWNKSPDKSRSVVQQSTIAQVPIGEVTVSDGKQVWQYDPSHHVVYTGPVSGANSQNTQNTNQFVLSLVRSIFNGSNATLASSNATVNGHTAYDVHITQSARSASATGVRLSYSGEIYLDKTSSLPLRSVLTIQGFGQVTIDFPMLTLNPQISDSLFTFVPPPGVKVEAFPTTSGTDTNSLTLSQAEQQAGYHLLSIPTSQSAYALQSIDALGAPGNQIYTLNYSYGNLKFAISEGKALANLPASGQQFKVRGTIGTLSSVGGITTLSWTEKGVGIQVAGALNNSQALAIAGLLS